MAGDDERQSVELRTVWASLRGSGDTEKRPEVHRCPFEAEEGRERVKDGSDMENCGGWEISPAMELMTVSRLIPSEKRGGSG